MSATVQVGMSEGRLGWVDAILAAGGNVELGRGLTTELREEVRRLQAVVVADRALMRKSSVAIEHLLDALSAEFENRHGLTPAVETARLTANCAMNDLWNMAEHGEVI